MADQVLRIIQAFWTTDQLAEELMPQGEEGGYHCLFLSGVVCEVQLELILCVVHGRAPAEIENRQNLLCQ